MQINVGAMSIKTIDKGYVSIGPSLQTNIKGRQHANYGSGQVIGDFNNQDIEVLAINDADLLDMPIKKIALNIAKGAAPQ